jgi:hypothetical protein
MLKMNRIAKKLLMVVVFLCTANVALAAWPTENIMGMDLNSVLNTVEQKTQSIILARMQQEAIKQIQSTMGDLMVGSIGHNSYVITSYEDFIYGTSRRAGEQMMTDFFKTMKQGVTQGEKDVLRQVEAKVKEDLFGGPWKQTMGEYVENEQGEKAVEPYSEMFSQNDLDDNTVDELKRFIKKASFYGYKDLDIDIYANTFDYDNSLSEKELMEISKQRAEYVKQLFLKEGAKENKIKVHINGNNDILFSNDDYRNNRVDIVIKKFKK